MKSQEFLPKAKTTDTKAWKNKKKNGALPVREGHLNEGPKINAAALATAVGLAGIAGYNRITYPERFQSPEERIQQSTQKKPEIKVPVAKKRGWETVQITDKFAGTTANQLRITSTDGVCILVAYKEHMGIQIYVGGKIDWLHHLDSRPRVKVDGKVDRVDPIEHRHISGNFVQIQGETVEKMLKTKQPFQVEIYIRDQGQTIYTFNP